MGGYGGDSTGGGIVRWIEDLKSLQGLTEAGRIGVELVLRELILGLR